MKVLLLFTLLQTQVSLGASGTFLDYCLDPQISPAEEVTVIAVMHAFKLWPERNKAGCEAANDMVLARLHLNLYPYPDQRPRDKVTDLKPLAGFTHLEELTLAWNAVSDLSPLVSLQRLKRLNLWHNGVTNLAPLAELHALETLYLSQNRISDLRPLGALKQLTELTLAENALEDLKPLFTLHALRYLNIAANNLTSIEGIAGLPRLEDLNVSDNKLDDLGSSGSSSLVHLDAQNNQIRDLRFFSTFPNLQTLSLAANGITAVGGLETLTKLRWLSLRANMIFDGTLLGRLLNLKQLHMAGNHLCPFPEALLALTLPHQGSNGDDISLVIDGLDAQACP